MKAKHDLSEVQRVVKTELKAPKSSVWFSCPPRSINKVIEARLRRSEKLDNSGAEKFILQRILELEPKDFITQNVQWDDQSYIADQYGIRHEGIPWFIKFVYDAKSEELDQLSCHPPERDMTLNSKIVIKKEWESI